jgi:flavin reductase (DIM6/NTAB) family NADH-FMN oxidoreductase RutF
MQMHAAHPIELQTFTSRDLRTALGTFATGVTVITTCGATEPYGMTANAFSAVSLDPPLVLVCVKSDSQGSECIRQNGVFVVNILTVEQEPISQYFASRDRMRGANAFAEIPYHMAASGAPVLEGTIAYLDCSVHGTCPAGDHVIFIGEVRALGIDPQARPLLFHGGRYRRIRDD